MAQTKRKRGTVASKKNSPSTPSKLTDTVVPNGELAAAETKVTNIAEPLALARIKDEYAIIIELLQGRFGFVRALLIEFWPEMQRDPRDETQLSVEGDAQWFWFTEMHFMVIFLYEVAFMEFSLSVTKPDSITVEQEQEKTTLTNRQDMEERVSFLLRLKNYVDDLAKCRLAATKQAGKRLPRVFRLAELYKLSAEETTLLHLLVVMQGCQSNAVRYQILDEDVQRRVLTYQRLSGLSEVDIAEFRNDEREHVKEGTLLVDEETYYTSLTLSNICVRVLLGRHLTSNQALKVSQTALEELLKDEGMSFGEVLDSSSISGTKIAGAGQKRDRNREKMDEDREDEDMDNSNATSESETEDRGDNEDSNGSAFSFIGKYKSDSKRAKRQEKADEQLLLRSAEAGSGNRHLLSSLMDSSELKAYSPENQLEYLEDRFQVVAFAIRASGARVKDQMKEAGTKQPWESSAPASAGRRELKAKQRVYSRRSQHRLALTRQADLPLPRLEELAVKFKLNHFEQNVIVMLIGKTISPVIKNLIDGVDTSPVQRMDESVIINQILSIFCDTFQEQVAHRVFFYKSSRLLSRGLVKLHRGRWHSTAGDLVDQRVELDRRVLDWVVGLDTEMNELVEGSDLYTPKVQLDQVVLPEEHKSTILETVESYESFRRYRKKSGLEQAGMAYGAGLVLLLCGASGTGKTMTVNAVAHHLKKRVLLVDFPSLQGKRHEGMETDADLRGLFREADMSNAVLFFDECENIFRQRDSGGDRLLNALLTEIERYEGIVFLATNRPYDLDEAMHRRITAVFEFKAPDHIQRRKIWDVLLMRGSLKTEDGIDWDAIALKYELSGGFIKNAILSALLKAIARDAESPVISQADIVAGCALQMRGSLHMKTFDHRVVPTTGLDELIVEDSVKDKLRRIVQFEKARSVIYGQWGFDFGQSNKQQKGVSVLICGPVGIGKLNAAKAIGFEIGRPLKVVGFGQLAADSAAETRKALRAVFDDARLMDAVLVLTGFESFGSHIEGGIIPLDSLESSPRFRIEVMRLLELMNTFPSTTILLANVERAAAASLVQSEFCRRLKFVVEMRNPNAKLREKLWRACFPPNAPLDMNKPIDFRRLAERYDLSNTAISDAVFRAAASAALREEAKRVITMKDLTDAAEIERQKARGGAGAMDNLFV
ncbi:aaa domain containing protein [Plasmopara halstedii]|uniref:Aaa domain containing protein n=1 Tax=Plasmopara halstedii TaxID=4781 RepID=A0A0P1AHF3_PLAHL|nr:aaa domain containing protein [Plasmopara halstedii]CEG40076.1 aaa domain containing protein [Plasmopara halstedii]|eukprot:XP_024576445.1 aaa domain containing protein [Plasmopara halstedii]